MNKPTSLRIRTMALAVACALPLAGVSAAHAALVIEQAPTVNPTPAVTAENAPSTATKASVVDPKTRKRIELDAYITSRIQQDGVPPEEIPVMRWLGKPMPLMDALKLVLPGGWRAYTDGDVDLQATVSWSGLLNWVMALNAVITSADLKAKIDWNQKEVTLIPMPKPVAAPAPAPTPAEQASAAPVIEGATPATSAPAASAAPAKAPEAVKPPPPAKRWALTPDRTLRENLRGLIESEGWTLVWDARRGDRVIDYPIDARFEFTGDLFGEKNVIDRVIGAYRDGGDVPLDVQFFEGNKVVRVFLYAAPAGMSAGRVPAQDSVISAPPVNTRK